VEKEILIVDDSQYIVDGLIALLKKKGFKPIAANGGEQAISALASGKPDLILLDIMMEPTDGWETLERIKANPETKDIPVLMFSAKKITPEEARIHSISIEDFVSKPVNPSQLLASIQRVFDRRSVLKEESLAAKESGIDPAVIEEYGALRKSIEVDSNLVGVLKRSCGQRQPGCGPSQEELTEIRALEEKIARDQKRLDEISGNIGPKEDR
jgi:DNA-binding response OmpR family regulator